MKKLTLKEKTRVAQKRAARQTNEKRNVARSTEYYRKNKKKCRFQRRVRYSLSVGNPRWRAKVRKQKRASWARLASDPRWLAKRAKWARLWRAARKANHGRI